MIYWFIGQPGCGKTTLARKLCSKLVELGSNPITLDGDDLRAIAGNSYKPTNFTKEYRIEQTQALQRLVAHLANQGHTVIVSTVNPYKEVREKFKDERRDLKEIFVYTFSGRCRQEFWAKDFEEPNGATENCIWIDTTGLRPDEAFQRVWDEL